MLLTEDVPTYQEHLVRYLKKGFQRIRNVLQVTSRRCSSVSGPSRKLLEEDVTRYQERLASYLKKTWQCIRNVLQVTWRRCSNVAGTPGVLVEKSFQRTRNVLQVTWRRVYNVSGTFGKFILTVGCLVGVLKIWRCSKGPIPMGWPEEEQHTTWWLIAQKNTLLRVIPTMTFIYFVTGKSAGILSDISSGILSGICSGNLLAFYLANILALYLAYLLVFYLTFYLTLYLAYLVVFYLAYLLTFYLAYLLTFYLAYLLAFYLAVEVQQCTLSWAGPRLRSSGAHGALTLAKSLAGEEEEDEEEDEEKNNCVDAYPVSVYIYMCVYICPILAIYNIYKYLFCSNRNRGRQMKGKWAELPTVLEEHACQLSAIH